MPLSADDPLLTPPDPSLWIEPVRAGDTGALDAAAGQIIDYFEASTLVFAARDGRGELAAPPDEHVLDHLARSHELVEEMEALTRPAAGTVCVLETRPSCDLCHAEDARYDTHLVHNGRRTGCFLCPRCFAEHGENRLGVGYAVYIMTFEEVSSGVRAVCDQLCRRRGRASLWQRT